MIRFSLSWAILSTSNHPGLTGQRMLFHAAQGPFLLSSAQNTPRATFLPTTKKLSLTQIKN
jgi:hypothetical protein